MSKHKVIGLMSGTSLDGLDIAYCEFDKKDHWHYKIKYAKTVKYNRKWKSALGSAIGMNKISLRQLDIEFGNFIGAEVRKFIRKTGVSVDLIASHGHTVFHNPGKGITLQIGSGKHISSIVRLPVVCDFRSGDVALGGQGAPLVPIVDKLLFPEYRFCLNLGGFANVSYEKRSKRVAFDICPVNIVLNELAHTFGKEFDAGGKVASKGKINPELLKRLNSLSFYKISPPKSLGREWVETHFLPVLHPFNIPVRDKLRTIVEHIAIQVAVAVNLPEQSGKNRMLITGGGAYNKFLIERISFHAKCRVILPDDKTIQFKEAMAFALLGLLKTRNEVNILKSVTGAKRDSSGGRIFFQD